LSIEVATVGDCLEFVRFEHFFGLLRTLVARPPPAQVLRIA
jgi:energy-converting hydrogenase Eha subunit E